MIIIVRNNEFIVRETNVPLIHCVVFQNELSFLSHNFTIENVIDSKWDSVVYVF